MTFKKGRSGNPAGRAVGSRNKRPWDDIALLCKEQQTPLERLLEIMHDEEATEERRDWATAAAAPFIHRKRGHVVEGDETEGQTIVIQVMDYGGSGTDEPTVIEDEATTVRVEGPA